MMAQLLVRQLDLAVKEGLRRRAQRHGRSMEEEVRLILARAVANEDEFSSCPAGLGSRIASLFTDADLEVDIREWRGETALQASFEA